MRLDEIAAAVATFRCPLVEITGGEPQKNVLPLMALLADGHIFAPRPAAPTIFRCRSQGPSHGFENAQERRCRGISSSIAHFGNAMK